MCLACFAGRRKERAEAGSHTCSLVASLHAWLCNHFARKASHASSYPPHDISLPITQRECFPNPYMSIRNSASSMMILYAGGSELVLVDNDLRYVRPLYHEKRCTSSGTCMYSGVTRHAPGLPISELLWESCSRSTAALPPLGVTRWQKSWDPPTRNLVNQ